MTATEAHSDPVSVGPSADYDALWDAARAAGSPLADLTQIEEITYYDGIVVDIVSDANGSTWLRHVVDDGHVDNAPSGTDGPYRIITHHLLVTDLAAVKATIHEAIVPTVETYRLATVIVRSEISYVHDKSGNRDFRYDQRVVPVQDLPEDELADPRLLPGRGMRFGPFDDPEQEFSGGDRSLYRYPVPKDEVLADLDIPRNWIGRFPDAADQVHLVVCVRDESDQYVQHRLTYSEESALRADLAAGCAPTMNSYRAAAKVHRETIESVGDRHHVLVEPITMFELGDERPSFESAAHYDASRLATTSVADENQA